MSHTLYRLEGCPFCELVVDELEKLDLGYESVWVEGRHSNRDAVRDVSGQRVVPVLVDENYGVTMAESERIIEFLETCYA
jgi:glutathione S-transferase